MGPVIASCGLELCNFFQRTSNRGDGDRLPAAVHEKFAAADRIGERQTLGGVEDLALVLLQKLPDGFYGFCHVTSRLQYNRFSLLHTMYKKHRMTKIMRCH